MARDKRKMKGQSKRSPQLYGDIYTVDHTDMKDCFSRPGLGSTAEHKYDHAFVQLDLATRFKCFDACSPMSTKETKKLLMHAKGSDEWNV